MNIIILALKLIIILGINEGLGLIQIKKANLIKNETLINVIFEFLYSLLRSLRGVLLFIVYICRRLVLNMYKESMGRITVKKLAENNNREIVDKNIKPLSMSTKDTEKLTKSHGIDEIFHITTSI